MSARQHLRDEIDIAFPPVPKPVGDAISFHADDCANCQLVREHLSQYDGPYLPDDAIRYLFDELSCLSAAGFRWVLPSYLRRCLALESGYDALETEFLIYNLAPGPEYEDEARARLSDLSQSQLRCVQHFVEWCQTDPHWASYCSAELEKAASFVRSLQEKSNAA